MDEEVEIVSLRATLRTPLPRRAAERSAATGPSGAAHASRGLLVHARASGSPFAIVERSSVGAAALPGPAILLEETATTYLDAEFEARAHESGSLFINDTREV